MNILLYFDNDCILTEKQKASNNQNNNEAVIVNVGKKKRKSRGNQRNRKKKLAENKIVANGETTNKNQVYTEKDAPIETNKKKGICYSYSASGKCSYGDNCKFRHIERPDPIPVVTEHESSSESTMINLPPKTNINSQETKNRKSNANQSTQDTNSVITKEEVSSNNASKIQTKQDNKDKSDKNSTTEKNNISNENKEMLMNNNEDEIDDDVTINEQNIDIKQFGIYPDSFIVGMYYIFIK